jgi:hypothetical protein
MNWEAIGAIGEIVGAIGVIATLLYLAAQIRQNTKAIKGATLDSLTQHKQAELRWSSDIATAWRKSIEEPENLTPDEAWQMTEWMTAAFVARQNEYFQYEQGLIDDDSWAASTIAIRMILGSDWGRNWWKEFAPHSFTDAFRSVIDDVIRETSVDYHEVLANLESRGK